MLLSVEISVMFEARLIMCWDNNARKDPEFVITAMQNADDDRLPSRNRRQQYWYWHFIIMKFISDKMSIETIKKKEKNPRTRTHTQFNICE